jgi:hypothetical protein
MREGKKPKVVVKRSEQSQLPPLFVPNPESVQSVRRCTRYSCRCIVPDNRNNCIVCGCRIISSEPLVKSTIFVEDF